MNLQHEKELATAHHLPRLDWVGALLVHTVHADAANRRMPRPVPRVPRDGLQPLIVEALVREFDEIGVLGTVVHVQVALLDLEVQRRSQNILHIRLLVLEESLL
jgi:hypothetical protein